MSSMFCEILSFAKPLYRGKACSLTVKGLDGELQILPGHIDYVNVLPPGKITVCLEDNSSQTYHHDGGVVDVTKDKTSVLVVSTVAG
mgnify:CR=1 FL=1